VVLTKVFFYKEKLRKRSGTEKKLDDDHIKHPVSRCARQPGFSVRLIKFPNLYYSQNGLKPESVSG